MTETEKLEQEAYEHNVPVDYIKFRSERINGLYVDGSIALRDGMTAARQLTPWPKNWSITILPLAISWI